MGTRRSIVSVFLIVSTLELVLSINPSERLRRRNDAQEIIETNIESINERSYLALSTRGVQFSLHRERDELGRQDEDILHAFFLRDLEMSLPDQTLFPTSTPVTNPTSIPISLPTALPTSFPSSIVLTTDPTPFPTMTPTQKETLALDPTAITNEPSSIPTLSPVTNSPTSKPITSIPTSAPVTTNPTIQPIVISAEPTKPPTKSPITGNPTLFPTKISIDGSDEPTPAPTRRPVAPPVPVPVRRTRSPRTRSPSSSPVVDNTAVPTSTSSSVTTTSETTVKCNVSPEIRAILIRIVINQVSDPGVVSTPGTPQNDASNWIINEDSSYLCPNDPRLPIRYSVAVFYFGTRGSRWLECNAPEDLSDEASIAAANEACTIEPIPDSGSDAWLTPSDYCFWGGIVCSIDGDIERISFERNGLAGTIVSELKQLTKLKFLVLEDGVISGEIPTEIGKNTELEVIDLNFNFIGGSLPDSLYDLFNLRQLDLNDNDFTGTISNKIGQLTSLTFLQLQNNKMSGTIPSEIGNLSSLGTATFQNNNMEGTMPSEVCDLQDSQLARLTSDCNEDSHGSSPPYVNCDCCTQCF